MSTLNSLHLRRFIDSLTVSCFSDFGVLRAAKAFLCTLQQSINQIPYNLLCTKIQHILIL